MDRLEKLFDVNFMEYASYVIRERAIPHLDDGLKPVQRRILQSLKDIHDGKFHKVANVVGHTMQYHPHGDASIYEALVALSHRKLLIDTQGNFGNPLTGDPPSAARYIECRLLPIASEILFSDKITRYEDSYDGRRKEPVTLPAKLPLPLILGAEGIAVGMSTRILPHNFAEVIQAEKSALLNKEFELFPDFHSGGFMDVSDYKQGNGKIISRARLDLSNPKKIIIRELPCGISTEGLIASIESAARNDKVKISVINDYTAETVEIEIQLPRGIHNQDVIESLYAFTDCQVSVAVNMLLVHKGKPVHTNVHELIQHHAGRLVELLREELKIEKAELMEKIHSRTLQKIFIVEKIYKKIEPLKTMQGILSAVHKGFEPYKAELHRQVSEQDMEGLLKIPIRRISQFDINRMQDEIRELKRREKEVRRHLRNIVEYALTRLDDILNKYGHLYPRHTRIESIEKVDLRSAARKNLKLRYNKDTGYLGFELTTGSVIFEASHYDRVLIIKKDASYMVIDVPQKLFIGKGMLYAGPVDRETCESVIFSIIYRDRANRYPYIKRCRITRYILSRNYSLLPDNAEIIKFTTRQDVAAILEFKQRSLIRATDNFPVSDYLVKGVKARGVRLKTKEFNRARFGPIQK